MKHKVSNDPEEQRTEGQAKDASGYVKENEVVAVDG
jgi:hypothetical protein